MGYYLYNIKQFNTLIITLKESNQKVENKKENDLVTLYEGNEVIGYNILNSNFVFSNFCSFNKKAIDLVKRKIKNADSFLNTKQFTVGLIEKCEEIEGTHLHKCIVNVGDQKLQIVCGAKNARKGLKTVCALEGSFMPDGSYISHSKLRGIDSYGMLCSKKELNLENDKLNKEGIIELDENYKVGQDLSNWWE